VVAANKCKQDTWVVKLDSQKRKSSIL